MAQSLKILHCLRTPVGGLFRHVCDLAVEQSKLGHHVGILCDSSTGGDNAVRKLNAIIPSCSLGIERIPMSRQLGPRDLTAYFSTVQLAEKNGYDVLHGHGAKGGAFARLAARKLKSQGKAVRVFYTPHGGSLHYNRDSLVGNVFLSLEKRLGSLTDGIIFESAYSSSVYDEKVGEAECERRVIPNGVSEDEFFKSIAKDDAADFVFVGELRDLKGIHYFIEALSQLNETRDVSAVIVGAGPDEQRFKEQVNQLGLSARVRFPGAMPAREAFAMGRCVVVPSLAESFPYIVLEAGAACMPMIATNVGGIPEIFGPLSHNLIAPADTPSLVAGMSACLEDSVSFEADATALQTRVREKFSVDVMTRSVLDFYHARSSGTLAA